MSEITIKETIEDKNSWFNVKRFTIKGIDNNFSLRTLDTNVINKSVYDSVKEFQKRQFIFEKSKILRNFSDIQQVMNEDSAGRVDDFFGRKTWMDLHPSLISLTLQFNPYAHIKKIENMSGFLNYLYSYSRSIILIPNILRSKTPYTNGERSKTEITIITYEDYIKFVEETYEFLSKKNNKPIFVPISLKFSITGIRSLIEHYIKKEHYYMWIDYEAKPVSPENSAKIQEINQAIKDSGHYNDCILFASNIKREITSHNKKDISPSSDVLGLLSGVNMVGVSRDPPKPIYNNKPKLEMIEHKSRIFDNKSYYYQKKPSTLLDKNRNVMLNTIKIAEEFDIQQKKFLEERRVDTYLKTKDMINDYHILEALSKKPKKVSLKDYF